jgi:uracil-DNA glycosylase
VTLAKLEESIQACQLCNSTLCMYGVEPRPIFSGVIGYPVFLLGQAPGKTEYKKRAPFQGEAGKSIKALFSECGLRDFEHTVYQTSVTKCFPGRRLRASTDRIPSTSEVNNCLPFLEQQLKLVKPKLLVCLGGLSWKAILSMLEAEQPGFCSREIGINRPENVKVPNIVGRRFNWRSTIVLPMIHPAGSANGARSNYPLLDHNSKKLLKTSFVELGLLDF